MYRKKETIIQNKEIKLKKNKEEEDFDSMSNLHKKYIADFPLFLMMSYSKFCYLRSF